MPSRSEPRVPPLALELGSAVAQKIRPDNPALGGESVSALAATKLLILTGFRQARSPLWERRKRDLDWSQVGGSLYPVSGNNRTFLRASIDR